MRHVVRHQIRPELVALVDHREERARAGMEGQPVRVAQAGRVDPRGPVARSTSQIAARPFSASIPFSTMFEFDPTDA